MLLPVLPSLLGTLAYTFCVPWLYTRSFVPNDICLMNAAAGEGDGVGVGEDAGVGVGVGIGSADGIKDVCRMNNWLSLVRKASPFGPQRSSEVGNPVAPGMLSEPSNRKVFMSKALRTKLPLPN